MFQIGQGVSYLHSRRIIHRDLKPMNIFLFKDGRVKIGDLGVAKVLLNTLSHTITGTPYYLSPEVCEEKPYNEKSDMWALGCILYEMVTLTKPFDAETQLSLFKKIVMGIPAEIKSSIKQLYSSSLFKLLGNLLVKDIHKRYDITQFLTCQWLDKPSLVKQMTNPYKSSIKVQSSIKVPLVKSSNYSMRVRINPKSKGNKLARQAILASNRPKTVTLPDDKRYEELMNKVDEFDKKLYVQQSVQSFNVKVDESLIDLTATGFMKKLLQSDYNEIFSEDQDIVPSLSEVENDSSQCRVVLEGYDLARRKTIELVGEENYNRIFNYYEELTNEQNGLTDEHEQLFDQFITKTLDGDEQVSYADFLESFYNVIYYKYMNDLAGQ